MLKRVVPTWRYIDVVASEVVSMAKTSSSGSVKAVAAVQSRPRSSRKTPVESSCRNTATGGAARPAWLVAGPGGAPGMTTPDTMHGLLFVGLSKPGQGSWEL